MDIRQENPQYKEHADLVEILRDKLTNPDLPDNYSWDDFFEDVGIPEDDRTDFAVAAINLMPL